MPMPRPIAELEAEAPIEDRRTPASARGIGVALRRLKGLLRRPLRLQRHGLQWHVVLVDRRLRPSPDEPPSQAQLLAELSARLLAIEHQHAAAGMRQLVRVHDELWRKGWPGVEGLSAWDLQRALAQGELLASLEASPAMTMLVDRLRLLKAAAEVREERRTAAQAEAASGQPEVSETNFDEFHDTVPGRTHTLSAATTLADKTAA